MQAVILAGGLGTRLKEETIIKPKPMVEVGGKPILWHIMKTFSHYGVRDFLILLGYKGESIKEYFLNYAYINNDIEVDVKKNKVELLAGKAVDDWNVKLVDTGLNTMTGGRLKRAAPYLQEDFFLTYGDGVADVDLGALLKFHKQHGKIATVTAVNPPSKFGSLKLEGSRVKSFSEKPVEGEGKINGGYFAMKKSVLRYIGGDATILEREPLEKIARDGQLMAFPHSGYWRCVDTVRELDLLNTEFASGHAPWVKW
jgi:glucose-1-phosphate cytidylyltransferase